MRVHTIAPGGADTEGSRTLGMIGGDFEKHLVSNTPFGRISQPEDIARVDVFLASSESGWVNGEKISVAGGWS
ncbi:MAG: SDR family oxidoreductase [Gemmatimonadaceae bacterium]